MTFLPTLTVHSSTCFLSLPFTHIVSVSCPAFSFLLVFVPPKLPAKPKMRKQLSHSFSSSSELLVAVISFSLFLSPLSSLPPLSLPQLTAPMPGSPDISLIASKTEGYSPADLKSLCTEAAMTALRHSMEASEVTTQHFTQALRVVRPSLTHATVRHPRARA